MKRVIYRNQTDGQLRVLAGGLEQWQADTVMAKWGNPKNPYCYLGPETRMQDCDGTPDGEVVQP